MIRIEIINILFFLGVFLFVSACSHENPLDKNALSLSGKFLYQASRFSEKKLNGGNVHGGYDYGRCIEGGGEYSASYCQAIYLNMVVFAKTKNSLYKDITVEDLTDANAYYPVKSYYDNQVYIGAE